MVNLEVGPWLLCSLGEEFWFRVTKQEYNKVVRNNEYNLEKINALNKLIL